MARRNQITPATDILPISQMLCIENARTRYACVFLSLEKYIRPRPVRVVVVVDLLVCMHVWYMVGSLIMYTLRYTHGPLSRVHA